MSRSKGRVTPNPRNASRNVYTNIRCNSPLDLVLTCLARYDVLLCLFPAKLCFLLFIVKRPLLSKPAYCWWCFLSEHFSVLADRTTFHTFQQSRTVQLQAARSVSVMQLNNTYHRSRDRTLFYRFDWQMSTKKTPVLTVKSLLWLPRP